MTEIRNTADKTKTQAMPQMERHWLSQFLIQSAWIQLGFLILTVGLTAVLVELPLTTLPSRTYSIGEFAQDDVKANQRYEIIDTDATNQAVQEGTREVKDIYDYDLTAMPMLIARISDGFDQIRKQVQTDVIGDNQIRQHLTAILDLELTNKEYQQLKSGGFSIRNQTFLIKLLEPLRSKMIALNKQFLEESQAQATGIVVRPLFRNISDQKGQPDLLKDNTIIRDFSSIHSIESARTLIEKRAQTMPTSLPAAATKILTDLAKRLVKPNLYYNKDETERQIEQIKKTISPVVIVVEKGEMIVRDGEKITKRQHTILEGIVKQRAQARKLNKVLTLGIYLLAFILILTAFSRKFFRKFTLTLRDQIVTSSLLVGSILIILLFLRIGTATASPLLTYNTFRFAIPFAFSVMLLRLILTSDITLYYTIILSAVVGIIFENNMTMAIYCLSSALFGTLFMSRCLQRIDIIKAGLYVGLLNGLLIELIPLLNPPSTLPVNYADVLFSGPQLAALAYGMVGGGLLSGGLVLFIQPLIENCGYTTDIKLLELANTNSPLLKELHIKAPGTFSHTLSVSLLAEAAAEAIGANHLFARVASLYHDIGKIKKPLYFVENQKSENRHDKLAPSMSALIINNHVKEGMELGVQYKLPQGIINIIPEHHGTSLITFFYEKAKKLQTEESPPLDESEYRYPGPKPQTREAGIVMLADAVEAAAKSLTQPTFDRLQSVVNSIINKFFTDGQLNECELTLRDLDTIANAFIRVLNGIYHHRVDYPSSFQALRRETPLAQLKADQSLVRDDNDTAEPTLADDTHPSDTPPKTQPDLKRLGITKTKNQE